MITQRNTIQTLEEVPLNCGDHPSFQGLSAIPLDLKSYFNQVFGIKGDIFKSCSLKWAPMRKLSFKGMFTSIKKLEL